MSFFENLKNKIPHVNHNFIIILVIAIAIPLTVLLAQQTQEIRKRAAAPDSSIKELSGFLMTQGKSSVSVNKFGVTSTLEGRQASVAIGKAKQRKDLMLKLAQDNPEEFLLNALPSKVTDTFSPLSRDFMEKQVKFSGKLVVLHYDDFKGKKDKHIYQVQQLDKENKVVKTYTLHFAKDTPLPLTDSKVNIEGYALDNELVVQGGGGDSAGFYVGDYTNSNPLGNQKILVIMFNFIDDISEPVSREKLNEIFFTGDRSVDKYIKEASKGKASITVDYAGYYKVPYSNFYCNNTDQWSTAAEAIAFANGIDLNAYPRHMFVFPTRGNCWAGAWATIGGVPSRSWMRENTEPGIYDHEFGHNLGLHHANSFDCGSKSINDFNEYGIPNDCKSNEYGDPTDVMGYGVYGVSFEYNALHKEELNWLDPSNIQLVNNNTTTTISSLEEVSATPKIIKIPIPASDEFYYVSYRKATGIDANMSEGITKGVSIHLWKKQNQIFDYFSEQTKLIDNTPEGTGYNDFSNSSLSDGQAFSDSYNGISIKQVSHDTDSAALDIKIDKSICRRQMPDVDISPISQVGSPGDELSYTINIKNNDTSQCDGSIFNFSTEANGPYQGNWGNSFLPNTVVLAPGQSTDIVEKIHSSGNSPIGVYTIQTSVTSNNMRQNVNLKSSYIVFGHLSLVNINPGEIEVALGSAPIGMSALAYDNNNQPIRNGVTYEWSMSSANSVGTLDPANGVINRFTPLKPGFGEITVKGTYNGDSVIKTVPVHVVGTISPTPTLSPTLKPSSTPTPTSIKTITLFPSADSFVKEDQQGTNYGSSSNFQTDSSPNTISLMKFNLSNLAGKTIKSAKLILKVSQTSSAVQSLKKMDDTNWTEGGVIFKNKPKVISTITTFSPNTSNSTITLNVLNAVNSRKGSTLSLGITTGVNKLTKFYSRQSTISSNRPQLVIEYQ